MVQRQIKSHENLSKKVPKKISDISQSQEVMNKSLDLLSDKVNLQITEQGVVNENIMDQFRKYNLDFNQFCKENRENRKNIINIGIDLKKVENRLNF